MKRSTGLKTLSAVTVVSRPYLLSDIARSLQVARRYLPVRWIVGVGFEDVGNQVASLDPTAEVFLTTTKDITGAPGKNEGIRIAQSNPTDWLYFLDDDNILAPDVAKTLRRLSPSSVLLFPQKFRNGEVRFPPIEVPEVAKVDLAMMVFPTVWGHEGVFRENLYESDWFYFEDIIKGGRPFRWMPGRFSYYNYLRP